MANEFLFSEYLKYPTEEEIKGIYQYSPILDDLHLEMKYQGKKQNPFMEIGQSRVFDTWLMLFNNKLGEVCWTYIFATHFFKEGIPDGEWYISPGKKGESVEYFPKFDEKHHYIKYLYDYYTDTFYHKLFSSLDCIFHLLNIYYQLNISPKIGFQKKVLNGIKIINPSLFQLFEDLRENQVFKKAGKFRNDLTHNFPPNDIDSGFSIVEGKGFKKMILGIGEYTPSKIIQENITAVIELLAKFLKDLKIKIEE